MNRLQKFVTNGLVSVIKKGGSLVSDAEYTKRTTICKTLEDGKPCQYYGIVTPLPTLEMEGCTKCGCPFQTKAKMATIAGQKISCPHPQGDKWN